MKNHLSALFTGNFHTERTRIFSESLALFIRDMDLNARLYLGTDSPEYLEGFTSKDLELDSNFYSMFSYCNYEKVEFLTISIGSIQMGRSPIDLEEFLSHLPRVPVILLEDEEEMPNNPGSIHITVNNYQGVYDLCSALIERLGCQRICMVAGPVHCNKEAELRYNAWWDAMTAHGIKVTDDMVAYGDFTERVDDLIESFFSDGEKPDAIMASNDNMALSAYRVIKKHGYTVGKDVLVTGFDDLIFAAKLDPPLTTIRQDHVKLAKATAEATRDILEGREMKSVRIPTDLVWRASTGDASLCLGLEKDGASDTPPWEKESFTSDEFFRMQNHLEKRSLVSSMMLRNLILEAKSKRSFFEKLGEQLRSIGTSASYVCLLEKPIRLSARQMLTAPEHVLMYLDQRGDDIRVFDDDNAPRIGYAGLSDYFGEEIPFGAVNFMLFYGDYQYGFLCAEIEPEEVLYYYSLSLEIGSALRHLYISLEQQELHRTLEEKNQILDFAATHDGLTELLNRNGVMEQALDYINGFDHRATFVGVMADLDHLKQINDHFGHAAGDTAILAATKILREALPEGAPLGRSGGDEFIACFRRTEEFTEKSFREKVADAAKRYNDSSGEPFYAEVSVGCAVFFAKDADAELTRILKQADEHLYEAKKKRRASVLKEEKHE